jgi:hypothetical protein
MLHDVDPNQVLRAMEIVWRGSRLLFGLLGKLSSRPRQDVALVVEINRPAVEDVKRFLEQRSIDADVVVVTRRDIAAGQNLPMEPAVWEEIVREYYDGFTQLQRQRGTRRFHVFLAAPAALVFAMGCTMSTQYDVHLYQWSESGTSDERTYVEVIRGTSRQRLMGGI